jgi:membrane-associated phospholipid phosphatase
VKQRALFRWTLGIVIAAVAIALSFNWDQSVVAFMANHQSVGLRNLMRNVSRFGDWPEHFLVGLALFSIARWRRDRKWARIFLSMLIALSIAGLAGRAIKVTTGRARPSVKSEQMWNGARWSDSKYHSFPSGHVDASLGFFAILLLANWRIGLPCLAIPIVIGFSRMYLGAHYLSDVVCAAVLGIASAIVVAKLIEPRLGKRELTHPR